MIDPVLAVHGGAGDAPIDAAGRPDAERELLAALSAGWAMLQSGGAALDAVEVAVAALERGGDSTRAAAPSPIAKVACRWTRPSWTATRPQAPSPP